jgi:oligoendopeptidase F
MTVAEKAKAVPQRESIDTKYTWDLTDIYPGDEAWEQDFAEAQQIIAGAAVFRGKLASSAEILYSCLEARSELLQKLHSLSQYAHLSLDLDNRVSRYQGLVERASVLSSQAAAAFAFVEPELLVVDQDKLLEMAGQFERTDVHDFYIRELIRFRKHIRSQEIEELLAMSSIIGRAPSNIFSMLDDADLTYGSIEDEEGREVTLTKQRFARFLESSDRRVRRDANAVFNDAYKEHVNTLASTLSAAVNRDVFIARARRYESSLHAALHGDNIPVSVYHSLLEATEANLDGLHEWVSLRKKLLKLDEIMPYDMICPLFPEKDYTVVYEDAVKQVLEAVGPLGEKYGDILRRGFDSRWIDVYETQGKSGGAYSSGNYNAHPYVLMNYNDTVDNMFTLAHEMGHAAHSYLTNEVQPYPKSQHSIFVAEVASTLNEGLLMHYLLDRVKDRTERLYLLNRYVDNTLGTFFHQVLFARFELAIHQEVENGGALTPDWLNDLWAQLTRKYYGPEITLDDYTPLKWSRIPHFYLNFYVYQYATSYAASQEILGRFLQGESGLIDKYLQMLSAGGRDHPIELLKLAGVDMSTPEPVLANLKMFKEQVEEIARLAG